MSDAAARREALDPRASFIVQAPAGSGKTELLIQRYLALLATVDEPEQILAITFTRKAAAEMRRRVGAALRDAAHATDDDALEPHRATTRALARRALERNEARGWALTEHAGRMRIETLDALNARLAGQLPTLSGGVGGLAITEDAAEDYRRAAQRAIDDVLDGGELAPAVRRLLRHFNYSVVRLETLIAQWLPKREQWLRRLAALDAPALRVELEGALERLVVEALDRAAEALPDEESGALLELAGQAAKRCAHGTGAEHVDVTAATDRARSLPARLAAWRTLAGIVLTGDDGWRQRFDRRTGFGPDYPAERAAITQLVRAFDDNETLRAALADARRLPDPRYSDAEWRVLEDLRALLLRAAAELRVGFATARCADFVELALAAQQALGGAGAPTELLLALDHHVRHILVDEFQDTSHGQLRLLETLTAGWGPGDGRTLFLVGDPMQSIYRFRDADMALFLRVRRDGLGAVRCRSLTLERNFRSDPAVIDWINAAFAAAFPLRDDMGRGEVRYTRSEASKVPSAHAAVREHVIESADDRDEVEAVLEIVAEERARVPDGTVAVLVQSRPHLAGLHRRLRAAGYSVSAVEIDPLNERQALQDLIALTRALLHPGDHLAWLSVLRAPWCGLRWRDLHALRLRERATSIIVRALRDAEVLAAMSPDGRERATRFAQRIDGLVARRGARPLAAWIEWVWRELDGPATLMSADDMRSVERFFATLARLARRGDLDDPAALDGLFAAERTEPPQSARPDVEIMTMHRAKGLEFDAVVLLGLARAPRPGEAKALYWLERVAADGSEDLLIAPWSPAGTGEDRLASLIRTADDARDCAERLRLLYVAATRAKRRLHLVARIPPGEASPPARSLLAPIWGRLRDVPRRSLCSPDVAAKDAAGRADGGEPLALQPRLRRLIAVPEPKRPAAEPSPRSPRPEFDWAGLPAVQIGTVVHRWLQQFAVNGVERWSPTAIDAARASFRNELELLGLAGPELDDAVGTVARALSAVLVDPVGRWLLGAHRDAASEHTLTMRAGNVLEHLRLDRTFIARDGYRWIVDYKTGSHEGADLDAFLATEVERYRLQLERYAAAWRGFAPEPIRLGLYFPLLGAFRWWVPGEAGVRTERDL